MIKKILSLICCFTLVLIIIDMNRKSYVNKFTSKNNKLEEYRKINYEINKKKKLCTRENKQLTDLIIDNPLSKDIKNLFPTYSNPPYYNTVSGKGVLRDVDELMRKKFLKFQ